MLSYYNNKTISFYLKINIEKGKSQTLYSRWRKSNFC